MNSVYVVLAFGVLPIFCILMLIAFRKNSLKNKYYNNGANKVLYVMGTDDFFMDKWRRYFRVVTKADIDEDMARNLLKKYIVSQKEISKAASRLNAENAKKLTPIIVRLRRQQEEDVMRDIGGNFAEKWNTMTDDVKRSILEEHFLINYGIDIDKLQDRLKVAIF